MLVVPDVGKNKGDALRGSGQEHSCIWVRCAVHVVGRCGRVELLG